MLHLRQAFWIRPFDLPVAHFNELGRHLDTKALWPLRTTTHLDLPIGVIGCIYLLKSEKPCSFSIHV